MQQYRHNDAEVVARSVNTLSKRQADKFDIPDKLLFLVAGPGRHKVREFASVQTCPIGYGSPNSDDDSRAHVSDSE